MPNSSSSSSPERKMFAMGAIGAIIVIGLIVGVLFVQSGSSVSEITRSSTTQSTSSNSSGTLQSSSSYITTSSSSIYSGPTGILGVSLTDPPIVPPGVTNVYMSYSSIQVHVADAGNEDGWYIVADSGSVDLMSLLNVSLTLGSSEVQTGVFNLISFNITSAAITLDGVNDTAYVPANRMIVPIAGGVSVTQGNSSGVLVDLSPQVIPYQNGTSISYVLVPQARSLPIPRDVWNYKLETKGAKLTEIQNQTWVTNQTGEVVVTGVKLSPNSFSLTLKNEGTGNATFSSIVVGQVLPFPNCVASPDNSTSANKASARPVDNGTQVSISTPNIEYVGTSLILLAGKVNPPPSSPNTTATVQVTNPNGVVLEVLNASVELSGAFHVTFVPGYSSVANDTSQWIQGAYYVVASYGDANGTTKFYWTPTTTTVTASNTVSSTSTTSDYTTSTSQNHANLTVATNGTNFFGNVGIMAYGGVDLLPAASSSGGLVLIRVISPAKLVVFATEVPLSQSGQFNTSFIAGDASPMSTVNSDGHQWVNGTYILYAYIQGGPVAYTKFQWSGPDPIAVTSTTTTSWTETAHTNTTQFIQGQVVKYMCSLYVSQDRDGMPLGFPVAYYAVLANNTLYPVNYTKIVLASLNHYYQKDHPNNSSAISSTSLISQAMLRYTLAPGQSVTFTYNGPVDTLTGILLSYLPRTFAVPSTLFSINPGQEYTIVASGPFDTRVATVVNATSTS